ncbi:MAG: class I SAM-dependent methyltransferase family protein [Nanoarchaeota archaeon]|nr:class I SAM-dependent methyltransferase family protein [Nanoarchaeota archaeon]
MSFRDQLLATVPEQLQEHLPNTYQQLGSICIFSLPAAVKSYKQAIGDAVLKVYPRFTTVCVQRGPISGELRQPTIERIAGNGTETVHKEHGILFHLDVTKVMFSKGNLAERKLLIPLVQPNEVVIDMFAGIGYFSLGIAKQVPVTLFAIEKNPDAVFYLKKNIVANKITNVTVVEGDCRTVSIPQKADRILMGYFPNTAQFLPTAFRMAKDTATIHYHDVGKHLRETIERHAKNAGFTVTAFSEHIVKSVGPRTNHVVCDVVVEKGLR